MPNVLSPRDLVSRPDIIDETVPDTHIHISHCAYMLMQITANFVSFPVFSEDTDCWFTLRVPKIYMLERN